MKRIRHDGQVSKQEYDQDVQISQTHSQFSKESYLSDYRATPETLSSRRILSIKRGDKKLEFAKHIKALNNSFHSWFRNEIKLSPSANLINGVQDYIDYSSQLESRYLRRFGEVLTFGSGDCGQLAHGNEEDDDLMVKFPRIVYSLRDKKVCGIACGGLHNAVWTETGQAYTWGCSDDGSLGRVGEETTPLLVQTLVDAEEIIIGMACGDGQTIAVSTSGRVWGWGCYKDKEGKKFFNPSSEGKLIFYIS